MHNLLVVSITKQYSDYKNKTQTPITHRKSPLQKEYADFKEEINLAEMKERLKQKSETSLKQSVRKTEVYL